MDLRKEAHSLSVVRKCNRISNSLSLEEASLLQTAALLHDVGFSMTSDWLKHTILGYQHAKKLGYPEIICNLILTHGYIDIGLKNEGLDYQEIRDIRKSENIIFGRLYKRLSYADFTVDNEGLEITISERVSRIINEHGEESPSGRTIREIEKHMREIEDILFAVEPL